MNKTTNSTQMNDFERDTKIAILTYIHNGVYRDASSITTAIINKLDIYNSDVVADVHRWAIEALMFWGYIESDLSADEVKGWERFLVAS